MSAPVVPDLVASGVNRNTILEVLMSGVWTPVGGVKNFDPTTDNANIADDGRYSDKGFSRGNKTGTGWSATCLVSRAPTVADTTVYDPAQEYLRQHGEGQTGGAAEVTIRWYEYDPTANTPRVEAKMGTAIVAYKGPGGDKLGTREATFTFTGQGQLQDIVHPYPNAASVPVVEARTPASLATGGGTAFRLVGAHFTGTTGVTIGGTAVTSFVLWGDNEITGVAAAHAASASAPVVVTNATGPSVSNPTFVYA